MRPRTCESRRLSPHLYVPEPDRHTFVALRTKSIRGSTQDPAPLPENQYEKPSRGEPDLIERFMTKLKSLIV